MKENALRKVDTTSRVDSTLDKTKVRIESPISWTIYFCNQMKQEFQAQHDINVVWERRKVTLARYEAQLRSGKEGLSHPFLPKNACGKDSVLIRKLTDKEIRAAFRLHLAE
jgi:hypothetical protein